MLLPLETLHLDAITFTVCSALYADCPCYYLKIESAESGPEMQVSMDDKLIVSHKTAYLAETLFK